MTRAWMTQACKGHRRILAAALGVILIAFPAASAERAPKPKRPSQQVEIPVAPPTVAVPQPEMLLALIRTTLVALSQAVDTGNFTVLRDLGAPSLQAANSPTQLGVIFADLQNRKIDLSPAVVLVPKLSEPPVVTPQNVLKLVGFVPTAPLQIRFQMMFQPVAGKWRLLGMSVHLVPVQAATAQRRDVRTATASIPAPALPARNPAPGRSTRSKTVN